MKYFACLKHCVCIIGRWCLFAVSWMSCWEGRKTCWPSWMTRTLSRWGTTMDGSSAGPSLYVSLLVSLLFQIDKTQNDYTHTMAMCWVMICCPILDQDGGMFSIDLVLSVLVQDGSAVRAVGRERTCFSCWPSIKVTRHIRCSPSLSCSTWATISSRSPASPVSYIPFSRTITLTFPNKSDATKYYLVRIFYAFVRDVWNYVGI